MVRQLHSETRCDHIVISWAIPPFFPKYYSITSTCVVFLNQQPNRKLQAQKILPSTTIEVKVEGAIRGCIYHLVLKAIYNHASIDPGIPFKITTPQEIPGIYGIYTYTYMYV